MPPKKKSIAKNRKKSTKGGKRKGSRKGSKKSQKSHTKGKRSSKKVVDANLDLPEYNAENVRDAMHEMDSAESPINLTMAILKKIRLSPINWYNYDSRAHAMKISNTAYSVVLTGLWGEQGKPYINGGPFLEDYEFSQIHFHWGQNNFEGSEHTVDGIAFPFELHAVFFKRSYGTHDKAKAEEDGIIVFVYLYKISQSMNQKLLPVTDALPSIVEAYTDTPIDALPLMSLIKNISEDYILYLGIMKYKCVHGVLWLICRDLMGISEGQLQNFRKLQDRYGNPMPKPFRDPQDLGNRNVFLVSPAHDSKVVVHPYVDPTRKRSKSVRSKGSKASSSSRGSRRSKGKKDKKKGKKGRKKVTKTTRTITTTKLTKRKLTKATAKKIAKKGKKKTPTRIRKSPAKKSK